MKEPIIFFTAVIVVTGAFVWAMISLDRADYERVKGLCQQQFHTERVTSIYKTGYFCVANDGSLRKPVGL